MKTNDILANARAEAIAADLWRKDIERRIEALNQELSSVPERSAVDGLKTIAEAVGRLMPDAKVELLGPQGVDCLMSIHACDKAGMTSSITFREDAEQRYSVVDYTRDTGEYARNTVGQRSGMNHPDKPIPETVDEVVDMLRAEMLRRAA